MHRRRLPIKPLHFHIKRTIVSRISTLRRCLRSFWNRFLACSMLKSRRHYNHPSPAAVYSTSSASPAAVMRARSLGDRGQDSSDLVPLKISLFGDPHIGKTSFLAKYAGIEQGKKEHSLRGINQVDKTLDVKGARISYSVWEVAGDSSSVDHIPVACKDSVAILFMFDLTSRCTLNSVIRWYKETRKWNQTAIPVLVGTKFDDFVQLPMDLQWTIAKEARSYAKALNATLFFSSATYNINVNKIFKFITAKIFNLEWNLERNLTVGEPIIDF